MKSPLEQIDELGDFIRQLHKIDSKLNAGQIIAAYRDNRRLIGLLETKKGDLIKVAKEAEALRVAHAQEDIDRVEQAQEVTQNVE